MVALTSNLVLSVAKCITSFSALFSPNLCSPGRVSGGYLCLRRRYSPNESDTYEGEDSRSELLARVKGKGHAIRTGWIDAVVFHVP